MNRRKFVKRGLGLGAMIGATAGGFWWLRPQLAPDQLTIAACLDKLEKFAAKKVIAHGEWSAFQILSHCAQSIEYSMQGYPQHKPDWFKQTIGRLAFNAFSTRGAMKHNLSEAIPGAPQLLLTHDISPAIQRLTNALLKFEQFKGRLKPHFAYGELTRAEYTLAHAMHINEHFAQLSVE